MFAVNIISVNPSVISTICHKVFSFLKIKQVKTYL